MVKKSPVRFIKTPFKVTPLPFLSLLLLQLSIMTSVLYLTHNSTFPLKPHTPSPLSVSVSLSVRQADMQAGLCTVSQHARSQGLGQAGVSHAAGARCWM